MSSEEVILEFAAGGGCAGWTPELKHFVCIPCRKMPGGPVYVIYGSVVSKRIGSSVAVPGVDRIDCRRIQLVEIRVIAFYDRDVIARNSLGTCLAVDENARILC